LKYEISIAKLTGKFEWNERGHKSRILKVTSETLSVFNDLFENGECLLNCHFYDINNDFIPVDYIDIWILN
jgi:hypothetical protein